MTKNILINQLKVDPKSNIPLHKQVEALIRKLISQKEFKEGKLLPKEVDLSKILGISRNTIRQATNKLVHEKLLIRTKGVGTKVAPPLMSTGLKNWYSFSQEMHTKGLEFLNHEIEISWIKSNADISFQLGIEMGSKVLKINRLRGLKNKPMVLFISYFHPRIGLTGSEDFTLNLYDILENEYQTIPANSKEEISAILATQELAQKLQIRVKDPILFRKRLVLDDANKVIEYNFCYYLATDFKYEITIKKPNLY